MNGLKKDLEEQIDNIEQYSRRQCLVFMGIEEEREENTDQVILEFCRDNLGIRILESWLDRSERLGPPRFADKGKKVNCPIISNFWSYRTREFIFSSKKKLKKSGFVIYENLTKERMELLKQMPGQKCLDKGREHFFSFNKQNKVSVIRFSKDLDHLNVPFNYVPIVLNDLEVQIIPFFPSA